jgi:hypothetical protein
MSSAPATQMATNISEPIIEPSEIPSGKSSHKFDLKILRDAFVNCIQADKTLLLSEYIRAYEELCV